ncbi:MAG: winged helix-turn-helix transcriptional regulator [Candidatus Aenigmarchaeota archaeon]|nr:winged helix-turn-helix transcriptional regulator [Candidatus Aenigmarchaeota archaeon]
MLKVFRRKEHKKNDMEHILILKKNLQRESRRQPSEVYDLEHIKERLDEISQKLSHLHERIDGLDGKKSEGKEDGIKKSKIKKIIEGNIREHGKLTSYDLSQILSLSRTRCSEYLNEMERAGIIKGVTIRRKRYYEIRQ